MRQAERANYSLKAVLDFYSLQGVEDILILSALEDRN
jgi:hypothetical protein